MWVRGLKLQDSQYHTKRADVAPYVGAWIETNDDNIMDHYMHVAPYVGAWIETKSD